MSMNAHWITVTSSSNIINKTAVRAVSKSLPPLCHTIFVNVLSLLMGTHQSAPMGICSTREVLLLRGRITSLKSKSPTALIRQWSYRWNAMILRIEESSLVTIVNRRVNVTHRLNAKYGLVHGILGNA